MREKEKGLPREAPPKAGAEWGQALLVVILTMVVALTVGLSVVTRSITTVRTTTAEEESQRAFSAAEAGIEQALKTGGDIAEQTLPNDARYSANVIQVIGSELLVGGGAPNPKDESVQIWLSRYPGYTSPYSGNITIYWSDQSAADGCPPTNNIAALEVILLSGNTTNPTVSRYALDPCSSRGNDFTVVSGGGGTVAGKTFRRGSMIPVTNGLIMRITPLYKQTSIGIRGSVSLPLQGTEIEATGKVVSGSQEITRKIKVYQSYPSLPGIFDYAIFSGTNL